ncbi:MAG: TrmH family RNA methyltransferase [bacterium]
MKNSKTPLVIILPNIRSAMNIGAIFRTADAVGVDKIYLSGYSATPKHPKVVKTAIGAEKTVPWEYNKDTKIIINDLKNLGYQIIGLEHTSTAEQIWDADLDFPIALIVGNEIHGIPDDQLRLCDKVIYLPMLGEKESLNVATATGIAAYNILERHLLASKK